MGVKLNILTVDGNLISFGRSSQYVAELVEHREIIYLQHAIKNGFLKDMIKGVSHSGDNYDEAV